MDPLRTIPFPASFNRRPTLGWVALRQMIEDVCSSLDSQLDARHIDVAIDVPRSQGLMADRVMLKLALSLLVSNAAEAMTDGGRLVVTSFIGRNGLELEVADSGPSLHQHEQRAAARAGARQQSLDVVRNIVAAHGGEVKAANCPEGGVAYTLRFPGQSSARQAA